MVRPIVQPLVLVSRSPSTPSTPASGPSAPEQNSASPKPSKRKTKKKGFGKKGNKQKGKAADSLSLKERLAQKRQADRFRKELTSFLSAVLFAAFLVGGLLGVVGGPKAGLGGAVAIIMLAASFKYPRLALWAFFIYVPFGGTITYAIGNSPLLQLAKDGFFIPALIGVVQFCKRERLPILIPKVAIAPLGVLLLCCTMTLLFVNGWQQLFGKSGEQPFAMGILGLKVLIGYAPLVVCTYYLIRNKAELLFLLRLTTILYLICCSLGFVQYLFLLTGRCEGTSLASGSDLFKATLDARCLVGGALLYSPQQGVIRLPGTFVAPWQWGWYLISGAFLTFAEAFSDPKPLWRTIGLVALGAVFVLAVVSGQRIALALVPTAVAILLVVTGQVTNLKRFIPIGLSLGLLLGIAAVKNPETVQERIDSLFGRWGASPPTQFITEQLNWALAGNAILGNGLGRATNAARALGETQLVETYYPKLIYEIGTFGTLAFLALVSSLTYATFKAYRSIRDKNLRSYASTLWVFVVFISYNTYYYPLDVDPVAVYYWFFAGVVLKLPEIERLAKLEEPEEESDPKQKKKRQRLKRPGFG